MKSETKFDIGGGPCATCGRPHVQGVWWPRHPYRSTVRPSTDTSPKSGWTDTDQPIPEDADIAAAFPTRSGLHEVYAEATRMVNAKRSKFAPIALVNWLLVRLSRMEEFVTGIESLERKRTVEWLRWKAGRVMIDLRMSDARDAENALLVQAVLSETADAIECGHVDRFFEKEEWR